jgi:hypothetical protein
MGDTVEVVIRGRQGAGRIAGPPEDNGRLPIIPLSKTIAGYGSVTRRQIRGVLIRGDSEQLRLGGGA